MSGLMLLDTPSLYFRAFYGVPESVTAPDGTPVNAVRGLIDMIARLVQDRSPDRLVCCMDADWRPAVRVAALPSYKAHRVADDGGDQTPDALEAQLPVIDAVLDAVGLARAGVPGYEADDVIGTLAVRGAADRPVDIVTGDRDLFQLVDDRAPVAVLYTARGIRNLQVMGEAEIAAKYGIPGRGYGEYATLRGDPSDGLPGCPASATRRRRRWSPGSGRSTASSRRWTRAPTRGSRRAPAAGWRPRASTWPPPRRWCGSSPTSTRRSWRSWRTGCPPSRATPRPRRAGRHLESRQPRQPPPERSFALSAAISLQFSPKVS